MNVTRKKDLIVIIKSLSEQGLCTVFFAYKAQQFVSKKVCLIALNLL